MSTLQPLPFPAPHGANYDGFTREQLLANLKVADANVKAVGGRPISGDASQYWDAHYVEDGINKALTKQFYAEHGQGHRAPTLQENLTAAGA